MKRKLGIARCGLTHRYECDETCRTGLLKKIKPHTFTEFAKRYGQTALLYYRKTVLLITVRASTAAMTILQMPKR